MITQQRSQLSLVFVTETGAGPDETPRHAERRMLKMLETGRYVAVHTG